MFWRERFCTGGGFCSWVMERWLVKKVARVSRFLQMDDERDRRTLEMGV
jgi:hypothetical protein